MIEVHVDGLSEPTNPGIGTYGFVVNKDGKKLSDGHGLAGEQVTNNYAEYEALVRGLSSVLSFSDEEITVKSDSRLLVNQMNGQWKIRKGSYIEKFREAKELARKFKSLRFVWVPREENTEADELSRVAYTEYLRQRRRVPVAR